MPQMTALINGQLWQPPPEGAILAFSNGYIIIFYFAGDSLPDPKDLGGTEPWELVKV